MYIPQSLDHPVVRIRKNGETYEITKKQPVKEGDASHQDEQTITLTETEFNELMKLEGKKVSKIRYYYPYKGRIAEIDVFTGKLRGLVLVDFEFENLTEKDSFVMPEFCLADVTQETFVAGGMVCGKSYEDIEENLKKYSYKKITYI